MRAKKYQMQVLYYNWKMHIIRQLEITKSEDDVQRVNTKQDFHSTNELRSVQKNLKGTYAHIEMSLFS